MYLSAFPHIATLRMSGIRVIVLKAHLQVDLAWLGRGMLQTE
jgi:hypothetical protein